MFLAVLRAEIVLLPVWAADTSISGMTRLPVTSSTTLLNSSTSKIWCSHWNFVHMCPRTRDNSEDKLPPMSNSIMFM